MGHMLQLVVLAASSDPVPNDNNVVAGSVGATVFVLLIVAVVLILRSFTKQLKKVDRAKEAGVYGDPPASETATEDDSTPSQPRQG
jgi:hypothetical protein